MRKLISYIGLGRLLQPVIIISICTTVHANTVPSSSPNDITYPSTDYGLGEHLSSNEATAAVTIADLIETSVRKQYATGIEPYRVCRRVNILRDYSDDKIKIYP
jgi:hypothetical protein